jgi:hypothetical protein
MSTLQNGHPLPKTLELLPHTRSLHDMFLHGGDCDGDDMNPLVKSRAKLEAKLLAAKKRVAHKQCK